MALISGTRLGLSEGLDTQVQGTNDDAQISKLSCSRAGYFDDNYVQYFVRKPARRSPLINRGYYSRYAALRQLLNRFLDATRAAGQAAQVLVLGAGFDTTWFQLAQAGRHPHRFLEVDFKQVTQRKVGMIRQQAALWQLVTSSHCSGATETPSGRHQAEQPSATAAAAVGACANVAATNPTSTTTTANRNDSGPPPSTQPGEGSHQSSGSPFPDGSSVIAQQQQQQGERVMHDTASAGGGQWHSSSGSPAGSCPAPGAVVSDTMQPAPAPAFQIPRLTRAQPATSGLPAAAPLPPGLQLDTTQGELISDRYAILPVDLRDGPALEAAMKRAGLDPSAPTYILSECVLVYMEPNSSSQVLSWAAATFSNAMVAVYEQIKPDDAFGRQMMCNLEARGCPLRGLPATPTLEHHCRRLVSCGWASACAWDMDAIYKWHLDAADKARVEALEVFDEFEEWHLIQEHYSISVGYTATTDHIDRPSPRNVDLSQVGFGEPGRVQLCSSDLQ